VRLVQGKLLSAGLGVLNLSEPWYWEICLADGIAAELGGLVAFVREFTGCYWAMVRLFLGVPLVRYFWIQWRNSKISDHNQHRHTAQQLASADAALSKIAMLVSLRQKRSSVKRIDLQTDLLEQEAERSAQIDAEWQRRSGS